MEDKKARGGAHMGSKGGVQISGGKKPAAADRPASKPREQFRLVIVGHVDHGKSTLIGRLFFETGSIPKDKLEEVKTICEQEGVGFEFAYLMDFLEEERAQGITIETAQSFFSTPKRDYVIIDAPGHREFTKNMVTGASQAEAAILIVDAVEGLQEQTRRHAYILSLLGIEQVIVAVNKMDIEGYGIERFCALKKELLAYLERLRIRPSDVIPVSAKEGENIIKPSERMGWWKGPCLLKALEAFKRRLSNEASPFRMPVQDVYRTGEKRIAVGMVVSGRVRAGDEIVVLPSGEKTRVASVEEFLNPAKTEAVSGESTGLVFIDKRFVEGGNVLSAPDNTPLIKDRLIGNVFWMSKTPLIKGETVVVKIATGEKKAAISSIKNRMDSSTLEIIEDDSEELMNNEVASVEFSLSGSMVFEGFNDTPELGRFVVEKNNDTAGGGIIILS